MIILKDQATHTHTHFRVTLKKFEMAGREKQQKMPVLNKGKPEKNLVLVYLLAISLLQ